MYLLYAFWYTKLFILFQSSNLLFIKKFSICHFFDMHLTGLLGRPRSSLSRPSNQDHLYYTMRLPIPYETLGRREEKKKDKLTSSSLFPKSGWRTRARRISGDGTWSERTHPLPPLSSDFRSLYVVKSFLPSSPFLVHLTLPSPFFSLSLSLHHRSDKVRSPKFSFFFLLQDAFRSKNRDCDSCWTW